MDISSLLGLALGIIAFVYGVYSSAGYSLSGLSAMIDIPSMIVTIVGSIGSMFISNPKEKAFKFLSYIMMALKEQKIDMLGTLRTLYTFAEKARRDGMISLEEDIGKIDDQFMRDGLRAAVDGTDPEEIRKILEIKMELYEDDQGGNIAVMESWGAYGPAFGMIGTLIGLILLLGQLNDPTAIGPYMAVALITTLYGALIANILATPVADKLKKRTAKMISMKRMTTEGILSIVQGENPRLMEEKLKAFLSAQDRAIYEKGKGEAQA
ncbi:MAG TPA: MotA/TolQ/ExbB proton channel family protein [Petrotogaceae bacterium]|nr:MotA/TolQ/ExbB proton channel family protein [Petrotogaceae bacterium]